ncbi:hypothetical protein [Pseudomonas aeruginosa]
MKGLTPDEINWNVAKKHTPGILRA